MKGVERRVAEALEKLMTGDLENGLLQASIAIDETAKKKYSKKLGNAASINVSLMRMRGYCIFS